MTRRIFFQKLLGISLIGFSGWFFYDKLFPKKFILNESDILKKYLDVLIPADETPSAVELGIDQKLFILFEKSDILKSLLKQGIMWLEQQAQYSFKKNFSHLKNEQIETMITLAEQAPFESLPHQFFRQIRHEALQLYYADPHSRLGLIWEQLPQPNGFMDYQHPYRS